ncbi:MAG: sigma-70 family RNA polymerase sigma factor [Bacteroidota bacterium]
MEKHHFLQIVNNNRGIIRSLCKIYYADSEDQKDTFQDIILQLWKSVGTFRGASEISTWIYRVSLNTILNKKRKGQRSISVEPLDMQLKDVQVAKADDNVELLHLIIQSLKDIDKAIVVLYLEGYRNKEIAEMLELSLTNVTTRFNRIKSQLKTKFNGKAHATKRS